MYTERLQILVTPEQRRQLEAEARRVGGSVASVIRAAVAAQFGTVTRADREQAVKRIAAMNGRFLSPQELERVFSEERAFEIKPASDSAKE